MNIDTHFTDLIAARADGIKFERERILKELQELKKQYHRGANNNMLDAYGTGYRSAMNNAYRDLRSLIEKLENE